MSRRVIRRLSKLQKMCTIRATFWNIIKHDKKNNIIFNLPELDRNRTIAGFDVNFIMCNAELFIGKWITFYSCVSSFAFDLLASGGSIHQSQFDKSEKYFNTSLRGSMEFSCFSTTCHMFLKARYNLSKPVFTIHLMRLTIWLSVLRELKNTKGSVEISFRYYLP